ncbi:MAG TPA: hopanoid biosynthesis-associated protein HpnK, partial [Enterovirga sp.]
MAAERSLVVTADDFGLSRAVNEAVEVAHRDGILTAASLMVAEPWAEDAIARARRLPGLAVGLHLVLIEARPMLPPERIPDLVRPDGKLRTDLARYGAEIFFRPSLKRQVAAEIEAQFEAYARTGLALDHVDAHKHYHLHPTIAGLLIAIGRRYGMQALRVPVEPVETLAHVEPVRRGFEARLAGPWAKMLRARARRAGLIVPDAVLGL